MASNDITEKITKNAIYIVFAETHLSILKIMVKDCTKFDYS